MPTDSSSSSRSRMDSLAARIAALQQRDQQQQQQQQQRQVPCQGGDADGALDAAGLLARAAVLRRRDSEGSNKDILQGGRQQQREQQPEQQQQELQAEQMQAEQVTVARGGGVADTRAAAAGLMHRAALLLHWDSAQQAAEDAEAVTGEQPEQYVQEWRESLNGTAEQHAAGNMPSSNIAAAGDGQPAPAAAAAAAGGRAGGGQAGPAAAAQPAGAAEQQPEQYVEQLRQLLAGGQYAPVGAGDDDGVEHGSIDVVGTQHQHQQQCSAADLDLDGTTAAKAPRAVQQGAAAAAAGNAGTQEATQPPQQQQQEQQQQREQEGFLVPDHVRRVLVLASWSLTAGHPAQARQQAALALTALQQQQQLAVVPAAVGNGAGININSSGGSSWQACLREAEQLHALATVLHKTEQQNWLAVLQLDSTSSNTNNSISSIQRAYRRLAGLIHPDKCSHPKAAAGFQALSQAMKAAMEASTAAGSADEGWQEDPDSGVDDAYAWWSAWEADVADGLVDGAAAAGSGGRSNKGDSATAADERELWGLDMQTLAAEVERRQSAIWTPQQDTPDAKFMPQQRQQRLKTARTVLSQRLQQQREQQVQQARAGLGLDEALDGGFAGNGTGDFVGGGGFMAEGYEVFLGEDSWESGVLKKQRL